MDSKALIAAIPVAADACLTHRKRCARPSIEQFTETDLRNFRRFCGAFLGALRQPPTAAGTASPVSSHRS